MPSIRNISVGLPVRSGHVLVSDGTDQVKGELFHRAIGGGIDFGETAEAALRREFVEELGVRLDTATLLGVVENIFDYEGTPGHEIAHVFAVFSADIDAIPLDAQLKILDEGSPVRWVHLTTTDRPLYPAGIKQALTTLTGGSTPPLTEHGALPISRLTRMHEHRGSVRGEAADDRSSDRGASAGAGH